MTLIWSVFSIAFLAWVPLCQASSKQLDHREIHQVEGHLNSVEKRTSPPNGCEPAKTAETRPNDYFSELLASWTDEQLCQDGAKARVRTQALELMNQLLEHEFDDPRFLPKFDVMNNQKFNEAIVFRWRRILAHLDQRSPNRYYSGAGNETATLAYVEKALSRGVNPITQYL